MQRASAEARQRFELAPNQHIHGPPMFPSGTMISGEAWDK
jgi:hypothetical protein